MMKSDIELTNQIDAYLRGELTDSEIADFEKKRVEDPAFDIKVVEQQNLVLHLTDYADRMKLSSEMNAIHESLDIYDLKSQVAPEAPIIRRMWKKYRINTAIAATVALIAVSGTLLSTGYFSKTISTNVSLLRREINSIKKSQNALIKNINDKPSTGPANPGQFGGTGFALSSNGYVVTNYHVVQGADSVYVQNSEGEAFKAKMIYIDPTYDLAVLQITDPAFKDLDILPYTFKKTVSDVGEDVFTIGFPRDDQVFGKGYLSSKNGYAGDTVAYQVSIPVNPGNSGGPLLDNRGNIIGIINGKQTQVDGAAFAIKSTYILKSIEAIPQDSLDQKLIISKRNSLSGLSRKDQFKKLEPFVYMVKVY
ncbi:Trypsin-like peptidase domain-containing protein [Daejeonella rubra]|uniref:Trypsin-like peptidase domain-containing protein n=1 Tax=Daejeonella rubra TaxID=990371 RepID=A0A1G9UIF7_9SPHI|nr:serine protease [Daejeonella rubra]SDM59699.1 Trypsin-like peptidase domain-containing protein [Daejeonella rubra]